MDTIPIISLGGPDDAVAGQLRAAATAHGFMYVADHGVPEALIADTFAWAARFFDLPLAAKEVLRLKNNRGWEGIGTQTLDQRSRPDQKESFYAGIDYAPDHPNVVAGLNGYAPNLWPPGLPGYREAMESYRDAVIALAERMMRHLARSLDLSPDYFDAAMREPAATLRILRYPPRPADAPPDEFGAGAHTDWGAITLLAQDALGGLEVQGADGRWIAARPVPGTFVVNLGDMIPRWTNGLYRSNPHRVINADASGRPRYSIPLFYSPNYHARIEAVPGTVAPGEAPRHAPCTSGEHLAEMYRRSYGLAA